MKLLPDRVRRPVLTIYERRLIQLLDTQRLPRHVAIICDGNRRWAREAGFDDVAHGHRVGGRSASPTCSAGVRVWVSRP